MEKPKVQHAGCGGDIETVYLAGETTYTFLSCQKCLCRITDPMELAPRGSSREKAPATAHWDRVEL